MPFLDVLVKQNEDRFTTQVYIKPTNSGNCLNGKSECPKRYKDSTIAAYIRRAISHCSTWKQVENEIQRSNKVLLSNGFTTADIDKQANRIINRWYTTKEATTKNEDINLYYKAHFSTCYKEEERIMKQIIKKNVTPTNKEKRLNLIIYYKSKKTSHILLRNSPDKEQDKAQQSHVVYRFSCNQGNCAALNTSYIGMTTVKLSRRLTYHLASGAPKSHMRKEHNKTLTREILEKNTEIITTCTDMRRLPILEALYIKEMEPSLNIQHLDLQALPSMKRKSAAEALSQSAPA